MKNNTETGITSKHYIIGNSIPVRIRYNEDGLRMGADVPDRASGELIKDATYISRVDTSFEVDDITEKVFVKCCKQFYANQKIERNA